MAFARRLYLIAGIYGLIVLVPQYFMEAKTGRDFPPAITHPEFYYGFVGVAVAFQVLFLILAKDPVRYRPVMIPAILEKASWGIAVVVLYLQQRVSAFFLCFGTVDLILGVLFVVAYAKTRDRASDPNASR
ncbi:MAG TPA: hypothetical protein VLE20_11840 [Blastocatellia bacterium]|jgi:hypothetical protein|nr:hypothetical protein [Blastocatellia bacterium]